MFLENTNFILTTAEQPQSMFLKFKLRGNDLVIST